MLAIFKAYIDIALLRRGPDSVPYSPPLLMLTLIALGATVLLAPPSPAFTLSQAAILMFFDILMNCSVIWLMLNALGRTQRFIQTMTALFGVKLILSVLQLFVQLVGGDAYTTPDADVNTTVLPVLVGIEFWFYVVMSFILRAALSIGVLQSIGLILLISMLLYGALRIVLPGLVPAA